MIGELTRVLCILRKSPVFAFTAIVTLTLAVAANRAAFDPLNSLLLRNMAAPH